MAVKKEKTKEKTKKKPAKKSASDKKPALKKKKTTKKDSDKTKLAKEKKYCEAVGRRKRSIARVRLFTCRPFNDDKARITVNNKPYGKFFSTLELKKIAASPLRKMKSANRFEVTAMVKGGGIRGQAEAVRHGLARALVKFNADFSKKLKRAGYLRRDPRKKERKKPGLKKARRAPQWKKR